MGSNREERFIRATEYTNMPWYEMEREKDSKRLRWLIEIPSEFVCSECGKKVIVDSYTYIAKIYGPNKDKKCPTCGHIPYEGLYYCSRECFEKALEKFGVKTHGKYKDEIKAIWADERKLLPEKEEGRKFHREFPRMAKELGFRVYKTGWPDFLIEKNDKYVGVEVKESPGVLAPNQKLMHEILKRAGLKVIVATPDTDLNEVFNNA